MPGIDEYLAYLEAAYYIEAELDAMETAELASIAVPDGLSDLVGTADINAAADDDIFASYLGQSAGTTDLLSAYLGAQSAYASAGGGSPVDTSQMWASNSGSDVGSEALTWYGNPTTSLPPNLRDGPGPITITFPSSWATQSAQTPPTPQSMQLSPNALQQLNEAIQAAVGPDDPDFFNSGQPGSISDVLSGTDWEDLLTPQAPSPAPKPQAPISPAPISLPPASLPAMQPWSMQTIYNPQGNPLVIPNGGIDFQELPPGALFAQTGGGDNGLGPVIRLPGEVIAVPRPTPQVSDPLALRAAEGMGHIQWGDVKQFGKGTANSIGWLTHREFEIDPEFSGAAQLGLGLGYNLQGEGAGALFSAGAKLLEAVSAESAGQSMLRGFLRDESGAIPLTAAARRFQKAQRELAELAEYIVPASEDETAALQQAYDETIAIGETRSAAGRRAHELLDAKGPGEGIDYGISLDGKLEYNGALIELKTHWGGPMEQLNFMETRLQLLRAAEGAGALNPGVEIGMYQYHLFFNPSTRLAVRLVF